MVSVEEIPMEEEGTPTTTTTTPSWEERLLDAEEIETVAQTYMKRPTAKMQLVSLAKKLRKEAAGLKALEKVESMDDIDMSKEKDDILDGGSAPITTTNTAKAVASTTTTTTTPAPHSPPIPTTSSSSASATHLPTVVSTTQKYTTIDKFAFDAGSSQDQFVTVYVTLPGIKDGCSRDDITCKFTKESFDLIIQNFHGKSYRLFKDKLEKDIDVEKSKYVVKSDKIIIKLAKIKGEYGSYDYWSKLTDPKRYDKKKNKNADNPAASITELMKEMYDSGDDQMKKMIGETMLKQRNGELGNGMGGMGGMGDFGDI